MQYLVIGYGNSLRRDDAAGQRVAEAVEAWNLAHVRSIVCHQLTPELAEELSRTEVAIFVDAAAPSEQLTTVKLELIEPDTNQITAAHTANPRSLLALAQWLYGTVPTAYWILIPTLDFGFGEQLSPMTQAGVNQALQVIQQLVHPSIQ